MHKARGGGAGWYRRIKKNEKSEKKLHRIIMIYSWLTKILYIYSLVKARFTQVLVFLKEKRNLHKDKGHVKYCSGSSAYEFMYEYLWDKVRVIFCAV